MNRWSNFSILSKGEGKEGLGSPLDDLRMGTKKESGDISLLSKRKKRPALDHHAKYAVPPVKCQNGHSMFSLPVFLALLRVSRSPWLDRSGRGAEPTVLCHSFRTRDIPCLLLLFRALREEERSKDRLFFAIPVASLMLASPVCSFLSSRFDGAWLTRNSVTSPPSCFH